MPWLQAYQEARQKGLRTYVEFNKGIPQAYTRHISKMRKTAEDLRALGMAEALKVLNEDEEDTASEVRGWPCMQASWEGSG